MKKILLSLLTVFALGASAQSVFTIEANDTSYSFPLTSTITITDNPLWVPDEKVQQPEYQSVLKSISLYGTYSVFQMRPMVLIADNLWAGKVMPTGMFKFSAVSYDNSDLYYGPAEKQTSIVVAGKASLASTNFYQFEEGFKQDSVLVLFNDKTSEYSIFGLSKDTGVPEGKVVTVDFEGDSWASLIDPQQYGGSLLYGEDGMGWDEDEGVYEWTDGVTSLHSKLNEFYESWCFWFGGTAVSNYHCAVEEGSFSTQLSIPTGICAHSGENFLILFGYEDGNPNGMSSCPILDFADNNARRVKGLWLTSTSYFLNSAINGDGFNAPVGENTFVDVVFEGFDADGNSTGIVKKRIVEGTNVLKEWAYVDLSSLESVVKLKVNYSFSDDQNGAYGYNLPAYVAIDDVEIYQ